MKKQVLIKIEWVFLALLGATLACSLPLQPSKTALPRITPPTATDTVPAVIELVPSDTPTLPPSTETPTAVPTQNPQPWRIPAMPGAIRLGNDQSTELDPQWKAIVDSAARGLSIPSPYFFEIYDLRDGIRFADVRTYYDNQISQIGMIKNTDDMGPNGNGTAVWLDPKNKSRRYVIKYYSANTQLQARMFIIYSNPQ